MAMSTYAEQHQALDWVRVQNQSARVRAIRINARLSTLRRANTSACLTVRVCARPTFVFITDTLQPTGTAQ